MQVESKTTSNNKLSASKQSDSTKQLPYKSPVLQKFGDIRDVTLNSSVVGTGDTGSMAMTDGVSGSRSSSRQSRK